MSAEVTRTETPAPFDAIFARLGIAAETYAHRPVFTVAEGDDIKHLIPGGHTKNLFLKDKKDKLFLITALWDTVIDLKSAPSKIGAASRVSFGSPDRLMNALGVTPGSVTPLALLHDQGRQVTPVLDARMMALDLMNCHPLINDKTTCLAPRDLEIFMKDLGYSPLILDFGT